MRRRFVALSMTALMLALTLAACSTTPTRFYTLATANVPVVDAVASDMSHQTFIEVLPVSVPERLARPQIVVRTGGTRVDILEQDRWSAPFNDELRDALVSGIGHRLGAVDVTRGGRPANQPFYRIVLALRQLDAVRDDKVEAVFGWTVTRSDNSSSAVCHLSVVEAVPGRGIDGVVQGIQHAVAQVADAIAADVAALRDGRNGRCSSG